jgi:hypothetical protein
MKNIIRHLIEIVEKNTEVEQNAKVKMESLNFFRNTKYQYIKFLIFKT